MTLQVSAPLPGWNLLPHTFLRLSPLSFKPHSVSLTAGPHTAGPGPRMRHCCVVGGRWRTFQGLCLSPFTPSSQWGLCLHGVEQGGAAVPCLESSLVLASVSPDAPASRPHLGLVLCQPVTKPFRVHLSCCSSGWGWPCDQGPRSTHGSNAQRRERRLWEGQ